MTNKVGWNCLGRVRWMALLLWMLPIAVLPPLGLLWLWQAQALVEWLSAMILCSAIGYAVQYGLSRRDQRLLQGAVTAPNVCWPPSAEGAWALVEQQAAAVHSEQWPLHDGERLWLLGRNTLEAVARYYHPQQEYPLLELTVPHTLLIIERASHDLRTAVTHHLPLSHRLTIGDLLRVWRWKDFAQQMMQVYRAGRFLVNPVNALLSEIWGHLRGETYRLAWKEIQTWLLREYVRKVGYYGIELYSGCLTLTDISPLAPSTTLPSSLPEDPLRIVVMGRANVGKSSLINALFGPLKAVVDGASSDTVITSYQMEREGSITALIVELPGCDTGLLQIKALKQTVLQTDILLWVSAAHRPDRQEERQMLDQIRRMFAGCPERRPPILLVAVSHIDLLRPSREWHPPYDLHHPIAGSKAAHIRAAVEAVANDLAVPIAEVVPVCLVKGQFYNVEDTLWALLVERQSEADKVRFLRSLEQRKRAENWTLLRQQLANAGRWFTGQCSG